MTSSLLDFCQDQPLRDVAAGDILIPEGQRTGRLLVLLQGRVEVLRGETRVTVLNQPGSVLGEMSLLLGVNHTATARALGPAQVYWIDDGARFLDQHPGAAFVIARLLAQRLNAATTYLVDLKRQFAGEHNHLEMVGEVLESLIFQQQRRVVSPGSERDPRRP
jgi:CRP-like cAMP-binding protein